MTRLAASGVVMESYWVLGQRLDFLATGETTGGHYSLFHVFIPAGPPGPLPHIHRNADEFFFVVEVRIEVLLEDAWHPLGPGQFLHVPRGTLHTFQNVTTDAARMLSGFVPSGFERFFRDFGHPARLEDVEPLPVQEAEILRLKATASQYDLELGRGDRAYVTGLGPGTVTTIDTVTHRVSSTVSVGPHGTDPFTVRASGEAIYVANQGASTLSVIDQNTFRATATIATGNSPYGIAVVPRGPTNG